MNHQSRKHAAVEYARLERLHSSLEEWGRPSPRKKLVLWLALSAVGWAPIIAAFIYLTRP